MIIIAGIGTEVGKTIVSAIITTQLKADYWKPIECGDSDTQRVKTLLDPNQHTIHPPLYSFPQPVSPHLAAKQSEKCIQPFLPPQKNHNLIIETAGGVLTPLSNTFTNLDLFQNWPATWILVSKHYLGSINHTLLTITALKQRGITPLGIIFNGDSNQASEEVITQISQVPCLGKIPHLHKITKEVIQHHAKHTLAPLYPNANSTRTDPHCERRGSLSLHAMRKKIH